VLGRLYTNTIEYFQGKVLYADHNIFVAALQCNNYLFKFRHKLGREVIDGNNFAARSGYL